MGWKRNLPLTFINGSGEYVTFTLQHKQGDKGIEPWTIALEAGKYRSEQGTSYDDHDDLWQGVCEFSNGKKKSSGDFHHWGVQGNYVAVSCAIYKGGFTMTGFKQGGGASSHHHFGWE